MTDAKEYNGYTAILEAWEECRLDTTTAILDGYILEDKKKRYKNGVPIRIFASSLTTNCREGDIVRSLNSTYLLGKSRCSKLNKTKGDVNVVRK